MSRQDWAVLKESSLGAVRTTGPAWKEGSKLEFFPFGFWSLFFLFERHLSGNLTVFLVQFQGLVGLSAAHETSTVGELFTSTA